MTDAEIVLPAFDANGNLPPGVYRVSMQEIRARFAWNATRRRLLDGLTRAVASLAAAGVRRVWIDGSFVTAKEEPNDIDGCWEPGPEVAADRLDPVFLDTTPPRKAMRREYGVDFLIAGTRLFDMAARGMTVESFFQFDRNLRRKGILLLEIGETP